MATRLKGADDVLFLPTEEVVAQSLGDQEGVLIPNEVSPKKRRARKEAVL